MATLKSILLNKNCSRLFEENIYNKPIKDIKVMKI